MDKAILTARRSQLKARWRWTWSIIGIDLAKRSGLDRLYLIYLVLFLSLWGLAVLAFLASSVTAIFTLSNYSPDQTAAVLLSFLFIYWFLQQLYNVSRKCPIVFSSPDAQLICQTPVSRRAVASTWFITEWPTVFLPIALVSLIIIFATVDVNIEIGDRYFVLWEYVLAGARMIPVIALLHFGSLGLLWSLGIIRLRMNDKQRFLFKLSTILLLFIFFMLMGTQINNIQSGVIPNAFPLRAVIDILLLAMKGDSWINAFWSSSLIGVAGITVLIAIASKLNMTLAVQETGSLHSQWTIMQMGFSRQAISRQTNRSKATRYDRIALSCTPEGWVVLVWKTILRNIRSLQISRLYPWILILLVAFAIFQYPHAEFTFWAIMLLVALLGERAYMRVREDLSYWWLTRQLPFGPSHYLLGCIIPTLLSSIFFVVLACTVSIHSHSTELFQYILALPFIVVAVAFCAVWDFLRKTNADRIVNEMIPEPGLYFFISGIGVVLLPFGVVRLIAPLQVHLLFPALAALLISLGYAYFAWGLCKRALQQIVRSEED
jgi:hypothetical protein